MRAYLSDASLKRRTARVNRGPVAGELPGVMALREAMRIVSDVEPTDWRALYRHAPAARGVLYRLRPAERAALAESLARFIALDLE